MMTSALARHLYAFDARMAWFSEREFGDATDRECQRYQLQVEASSVALDMAVAAESDERIRATVAWA